MNAMSEIANLLLGTAFSLYIGILWVRFLLQLVQADFYNPISQFVVKASAPVLNPLRQIMPKHKYWDFSALFAIVLLQLLSMTLMSLISGHGTLPPILLVLSAIFQLIYLATEFYFWAIIISIVLSWISPGYSPFAALLQQITEPVLAPFRKLLPAMGGLDLSPILAFLMIQILQILLRAMSQSLFSLNF
ncbi:YggT family protein [Agitococcus lubricus]|uniref:YggT family protein n=1 Tax=Agitococcus lubricus TaxID=1077255 RepID=A0A2T5J3J9_9GAMM|nr:YggT family protein [Agitococcus lubricus]PTQ91146.1 YggT family protein [Agitococcus lubricus]